MSARNVRADGSLADVELGEGLGQGFRFLRVSRIRLSGIKCFPIVTDLHSDFSCRHLSSHFEKRAFD